MTPQAKEALILGIVIPLSILIVIFIAGVIFLRIRKARALEIDSQGLTRPIVTPNEDQQTFYSATDYTAFSDDSGSVTDHAPNQ